MSSTSAMDAMSAPQCSDTVPTRTSVAQAVASIDGKVAPSEPTIEHKAAETRAETTSFLRGPMEKAKQKMTAMASGIPYGHTLVRHASQLSIGALLFICIITLSRLYLRSPTCPTQRGHIIATIGSDISAPHTFQMFDIAPCTTEKIVIDFDAYGLMLESAATINISINKALLKTVVEHKAKIEVLEFENEQLKANSMADNTANRLWHQRYTTTVEDKDEMSARIDGLERRIMNAAWRDLGATLSTTLSSLISPCPHFRHPRYAVLDWAVSSSH
jgi:hypothetical protein